MAAFMLAFGGLLGSVLTIIVNSIIESSQKKAEHKRLIQKIYFEKKLAACEKAANLWYSIKSKLAAVIQAIKAGEGVEDYSYYGLEQTFQKFNESIADLDQAISKEGNTIALYFDLDEIGDYKKESAKEFYMELSSAGDLMFQMKFHQDLLEKETNTLIKEKIEAAIEDLIPKLKEKLLSLGSFFEPMEQYFEQLIRTIRKDLSKEIS